MIKNDNKRGNRGHIMFPTGGQVGKFPVKGVDIM